ncbi:hypothetical protein [Flavivirga algicola]|uniref:Helix-turn-helix domain-containing protein n=1 Tax=Flavivirga algicola TaxID=2729136 RepID=A0ABX1RYN1_9FLAO|nr:hypothetical protein [Flavivirga algicola]NMH87532.1 hypothetical protein [Flavivirga algicola]
MEKEHYSSIVETIIASKSFGRSDTYANLFRYLVECTIESQIPKETTIANDIFGKEQFDPSQSTLIRVYVYNLRKKLAGYYENEGINDTTVLKIPKGSYKVQFIKKDDQLAKKKSYNKVWVTLIILSVIAIPFLFDIARNRTNEVRQTELWSDLFASKNNTMMVLGDLFIYEETDSITGQVKTVRDPSINSPEEFDTIKSVYTRKGIAFESLSYSFLIRNSALWVKDLSEVFYEAEKDFVIRTMSRFNPKELPDNDLVVVGMIKTLGLFKDYINKEGYSINDSKLNYWNGNLKKHETYIANGDADKYHTDYAILLKVPGANSNNTIYLFGGIWDTGASQSFKHFTDYELAIELEKAMKNKFGEIPKYYKVLFEVSGIDRMELSSKIIHLEKIDSNLNL